MRDGTDITAHARHAGVRRRHARRRRHQRAELGRRHADETEICGCNGVCKGTITTAITEKKLFTLDEVRAHTKASASCGSCTALVEQLLAFTLGGDYSAAPKVKPVCKCTDHSHDDVRRVIVEQNLQDHSQR